MVFAFRAFLLQDYHLDGSLELLLSIHQLIDKASKQTKSKMNAAPVSSKLIMLVFTKGSNVMIKKPERQ